MGERPSLHISSEEPPAKPENLEALKQRIIDSRTYILNSCKLLLHHKDDALAEDLSQETMINALRGAENFRGDSKLSSWLFRIAKNVVFGHIRRGKAKKYSGAEVDIDDREIEGEISALPEKQDEEALTIFGVDLEKALKELSDDDADIILSVAIGYTAQEIADTRKISLSAAKTRVHRARLALKELMADHAGKK